MKSRGFTLIELMIVIAILGILLTTAMPTFQDRIIRTQVSEAVAFADFARTSVAEYYRRHQRFPKDNGEAGLPAAERIVGSYVTRLDVRDGAIHVTLGHRVNRNAEGKVISFRPGAVPGAPVVPLSWACGNAALPEALRLSGRNETTLLPQFLPIDCRS